eukprot:CAMPEP_0115003976 /NCGR_PEP_ID=MMETSP0216-20121206/18932_1 /TAXON_ID=223996 /ORGANISM="Protocruzia adherens, Strain Boccale" /LENGTH=595 /DNA_ID=CAMNT_0002369885 /DNA_START=54 /DNA_END=1841 /DNA_ORIENTATION=-
MALGYQIVHWFFRFVLNIFFRDITIIGKENIPKEGAVIFCGNHNNQFIDGMMIFAYCQRESSLLVAEKSMHRRVIGDFAKLMNSIPVARPQDKVFNGKGTLKSSGDTLVTGTDTEFTKTLKPGDVLKLGAIGDYVVKEIVSDTELHLKEVPAGVFDNQKYKVLPKIDQAEIYSKVWERLNQGGCIGIFPEGGSHDRSDLLPLKAGVTLMALGAMQKFKVPVYVVAFGLNYYNASKFRSQVVIEFGEPYEIPQNLVELYGTDRRSACSTMLTEIEHRLRDVTLTAPSYHVLQSILYARRLYTPRDKSLTKEEETLIHRRLSRAFSVMKNNQTLQSLLNEIRLYIRELHELGLKDSQVTRTSTKYQNKLIWNMMYAFVMMFISILFALPSGIIGLPILLALKYLAEQERKKALANSSVKVRGMDVMASHKVKLSLVIVPLYLLAFSFIWFLAAIFVLCDSWFQVFWTTIVFTVLWFLYCVGCVKLYDGFVRHFLAFKACLMALIRPRKLRNLKQNRDKIQDDLRGFIAEHGPKVIPDFNTKRIITEAELERDAFTRSKTYLDTTETEEEEDFDESSDMRMNDPQLIDQYLENSENYY